MTVATSTLSLTLDSHRGYLITNAEIVQQADVLNSELLLIVNASSGDRYFVESDLIVEQLHQHYARFPGQPMMLPEVITYLIRGDSYEFTRTLLSFKRNPRVVATAQSTGL